MCLDQYQETFDLLSFFQKMRTDAQFTPPIQGKCRYRLKIMLIAKAKSWFRVIYPSPFKIDFGL